jgi:predicted permease
MPETLRHSLRRLLKTPGFSLVAVLTLALGIGANTAVFSVMNTVLLRFLPVQRPQQLVLLHLRNQPLGTSQSGWDDSSLTLPLFRAMRERQDVFSDVVGFAPLNFGSVPVRYGAEPEEALGETVSGNFFSGLGVRPTLGRTFTPEDESEGAPVAVLSNRWWRTRFGASPEVLGRTLNVRGVPITIVGVAQPGFDGTDPGQPVTQFWIPLQRNTALAPWANAPSAATLYGSPNWLCLLVIGRLVPSVSLEQARTNLSPLFESTLAQTAPPKPGEQKPQLALSTIHGIGTLRDDYERPLRVLMAMVVLVLLIASANVAMLILLRNGARRQEFALRRALGADTGALFAQLLSESALLVGGGAILGWLLAPPATGALTRWSGLELIVEPDGRVLWFTLLLSSIVALVFALVPIRLAANAPLAPSLRGAAAAQGVERLWGRKVVVVTQVSLCVVLLFGGELLYATLRNLESNNLGLRTSGLLVFGVTPPSGIQTDAEAARFHLDLLRSLRALPGVDQATMTAVRLGVGGANNDGVLVDGKNPLPSKPLAPMRENEAGPDFLRTFGIPLSRGRDFDGDDMGNPTRVAIVDQTFTDRYLPGQDPLGHQIAFLGKPKDPYTIVGVARNSRYTGVNEPDRPVAYIPFNQVSGIAGMQYALHTSLEDPRALLPGAARIIRGVDPNLVVEKPATQREQFDMTISRERLVARLSIFFALAAMSLVMLGLYGTISYSVGRRRKEIGIRIALGAGRDAVLGLVVREGTALTLAGLGIGLPLAFGAAWVLRSMTHGLSPADPVASLVAIAGIALVALLATILPARRAASVDPVQAIRTE